MATLGPTECRKKSSMSGISRGRATISIQFLPAGKCQHRVVSVAPRSAPWMARSQSRYTRILGNGLLEQAEATQYHREQVVEVVRYPSGQLTDAFHFLGFVQLPQRDLPLAR